MPPGRDTPLATGQAALDRWRPGLTVRWLMPPEKPVRRISRQARYHLRQRRLRKRLARQAPLFARELERPRHPDLQHAMLVDDDVLDAAESQNLAWAARETGTLGRYWETEDQLKGYAWYDTLPRVVGVNVRVTARGRTETSTRQTRRDHAPCRRGPVDRLELELIVKRPGCDASNTIPMPTSAALLSGDGSGVSRDDPDFVTSRDAGIDTETLETALLDAYFQPSLDAEADSLDPQMREYRRRMAYSITELLDSAEAAADGTIRRLVESCILPAIDGGSNVDIEIRNGGLAAVRRL